MKKRIALPLVAAALMMVAAAFAQPPGGGGPGGGGGFNFTPEMRAKMEKFRKFSENHKNYRTLTLTMRSIVEMDKEAKTKLTKDQAKKIWSAVSPWTSKPVMTDAQALSLNKQIAGVLNTGQLKKMAAVAAEQGRRGFGGGGGGGRPGGAGGGGFGGGGGAPGGGGGGGFGGGGGRPGGGGAGGGGGGRGNFDFSKMPDPKEYNPINVNSYQDSPFSQRMKLRTTEFLTLIKSRAA